MAKENTNSKDTKATAAKKEKIEIPKDIDLNEYIPVRNGFQGKLLYKSSRTGESITWDEFGDEQEIELKELKNARSSAKAYYANNWFVFDDEYAWVPYYLGIGKYYDNALNIEEMNELFDKSPAEIKKIISKVSNGQKRSITYKAVYMVQNNLIDSNRTVASLEEALGVKLTER